MYCRVISRMDDKNRLKLEFQLRPYAYFITLSYATEHLFTCGGLPTLYKPDLDSLIDRVRKKLPKVTVYGVGEYGGRLFGNPDAEREIHPHYHVAIFSQYKELETAVRSAFESSWQMGHAHILQLSGGLVDYITGYHASKLTNIKSMETVKGLQIMPEFSWRSRRPAVGDISELLVQTAEQYGVIPKYITIDGKNVIIPEFLRRKTEFLLLTWDLDLKGVFSKTKVVDGKRVTVDPLVAAIDLGKYDQYKIYLQRKEARSAEKMSLLQEKQKEQEEEILANPSLSGTLEKRTKELKKQITINFEARHKLQKYSRKKVL